MQIIAWRFPDSIISHFSESNGSCTPLGKTLCVAAEGCVDTNKNETLINHLNTPINDQDTICNVWESDNNYSNLITDNRTCCWNYFETKWNT